MSVYVDPPAWPLGRMKMCHMISDSDDELHAMADKIGVARGWFQGWDKHKYGHYDICKSKRTIAIKYGAIEIDRRTCVKIVARMSEARTAAVKGDRNG